MIASPFVELTASSAALHSTLASHLEYSREQPGVAIGLIGCGWIGGEQLSAYREAGFDVVAILDRDIGEARKYVAEYFPAATAFDDLARFLDDPRSEIVDIATHVAGRDELIMRSLEAGKHVLSQKPFVEDLEIGRRIDDAARERGMVLAVNQNGRWAPHFDALLRVVRSGVLGAIVSADFDVAWPHHEAIAGKPAFEGMDDLILFDFGAHWFDLLGVLAPSGVAHVFATTGRRRGQTIDAPLNATAVVEAADFCGTVTFRGGEVHQPGGWFRVSGDWGVISHVGNPLGGGSLTVTTGEGVATIRVADDWFRYGLSGSMGAAIRAIEARTPAVHSAASSLRGLEFCFAALASARSGVAVASGTVTKRMPE